MFNKGIWKGLNPWIPVGGQIAPTSIFGDNLLWKNAQKNETKRKTSEIINKIIPHRKPTPTLKEWNPWSVPSRLISRHHWVATIVALTIPVKNNKGLKVWNHCTIPTVKVNAAIALAMGQGLILTKW